MTANATVEDVSKSSAAGMNDHITKPIYPGRLFGALLRWIKPGDRVLPAPVGATEDTAEAETVPDLSGIDVESGVARVGGDARAYIKLLKKFRDNQADAIESIRTALADDQTDDAIRLAHTLKGVGGTTGDSRVEAMLPADTANNTILFPAAELMSGLEFGAAQTLTDPVRAEVIARFKSA